MAALTGNQIKNSYTGLLKTSDNLPISGTAKTMQDGAGNDVPLEISNSAIIFTGEADFTNATVTGLPSSAPSWNIGTRSSGMRVTSSNDGPYTGVTDRTFFIPMFLGAGMQLDTFNFGLVTSYTSATLSVYLYDSQRRNPASGNAQIIPRNKLATLTSGINLSQTPGQIETAISYQVSNSGLYWVALSIEGDLDGVQWRSSNTAADSNQSSLTWSGASSMTFATAANMEKMYYNGAVPPDAIDSQATGVNSTVTNFLFWFNHS